MSGVLGIINLINEKPYLKELTKHRSLASVPFAGRYRLIDFTLSNFIHADITEVTIFTKTKFRSIMDHVGSGIEWDLDRRHGGLFLLPPINPEEQIKGDIQQFYEHLEMFKRVSAEMVVIAPGHHAGKIDYQDVMHKHRESNADITVVYKDYNGTPTDKPIYHMCSVARDGRVTDIEMFTRPVEGDHVCLETYVIQKELLIQLMERCMENNEYDFLKDVIKANLYRLHIQSYHFQGHMPFIHSNESYLDGNMEFLDPDLLRSCFYDGWDIYTKVKHESPAMYASTSNVKHSIIANGCEIEGTVENSILFRGVKIGKGAVVKDSIIMQKSEVGAGASIARVIADKQVKISAKTVIDPQFDPTVCRKSKTI